MTLGLLAALGTLVGTVGLMAVAGELLAFAALAGLAAPAVWPPAVHQLNAGVRFFVLLRTGSRYGERLATHDATLRVLQGLRTWFFRRLAPLAPAGLGGARRGDLLERIVRDIDALTGLYVQLVVPWLATLLVTLAALVLLAWLVPPVALVAVVAWGAVTVALPVAAVGRAELLDRVLAEASRNLRVAWVDALQGARELTILGALPQQVDELRQRSQRLLASQRRRDSFLGAAEVLGQALVGIIFLVSLWLAVGAVSRGALSGQHLTLVVLVMLTLGELLLAPGLAFPVWSEARVAWRRLLAMAEQPSATPLPSRPVSPPDETTLRLEDVCFSYGPQQPLVLDSLSLAIPAGARVALTGPSGAGKSTLLLLTTRLWDPTKGRVTIGGCDVRDLAEEDLRQLVSAVSQRPHLFVGTVADQLRLGKTDATDEEMWRVLSLVRLSEKVRDLPLGLETPLGAGGTVLSGGQTRRLALARALLKPAPVLVLDEPTEDLDEPTAQAVLDGVFAATPGRTVIVITHRVHLAERFDQVLRLEGGRLLPS
jgi:ATP-binding cassette subfamily C protein CydC